MNPLILWTCFLVVFLLFLVFVLPYTPWRLRWKITLGLSAALVIVASYTGLLVATNRLAPSAHVPPAHVTPTPVNVPAPVSTSLTLSFIQSVYPNLTAKSPNEILVTIDASTGALRWQKNVGDTPVWLAADAQTLYLTTYATVTALRASDGTQLWQTQLNAPGNPDYPSNPVHPILADGMLYIDAFLSGGKDGIIYALHAADGTIAWSQYEQGDALTAGDGLVIVGSISGVTAYQGSTGASVWHWGPPPNFEYRIYPFFAGSAVYAIDGNDIQALQTSNGALLWSYYVDGITGQPWLTIGASSIYVSVLDSTQSKPFSIYSVNAQTGQLRWKYQAGKSFTFGTVEVGNLVYVAGDGYLAALRVSDGLPVWQQSALMYSAPLLVNGVLFVKSFAATIPSPQPTCPPSCEAPEGVNALDASTGSLYWRASWPGIDMMTPLEGDASSPA